MKKLTGIFAPVPTFIDDKGKIDFNANKNACERLLKSEINGLFIMGTTGEFAYFSVEERKEYIKFLLKDSIIKAPMIICVSHWSTEKAVDLAKYAAQLGAKYISALLPTYYPISDNSIKNYFRSIRKAVNEIDPEISLLMYHIPIIPSTANIKAEIIAELANEGTLNGIKNSTFELSHAQTLLNAVSNEFNFLCGTVPLLLEAYREENIIKKFDGGVFSGADVLPNSYSRLLNAGIKGDKENFLRIFPVIDEFTALWDIGINYLPAICKYAMKYLGYKVNDNVCRPLDPITPKMEQKVEKVIDKIRSYWGSDEI